MDGAFDTYWQEPSATSAQLESINSALNTTLDPRISNDLRQHALEYLEQVKHQTGAPHYGFTLADDWAQNDAVRYYGLQLLEYAVRYRWADYTAEQTHQLRSWVKCLAGSVRDEDAMYIRNKIGQLWVELAKRCWGDDWPEMDTLLLTLWEKPMAEKGTANKTLVLYILQMLSEDITGGEDAVAGLRMDQLGNALNDIMAPAGEYTEFGPSRTERPRLHSNGEGWVERVCAFLNMCVKQVRLSNNPDLVQSMSFCAFKALHALRPTMSWINFKAALDANCTECFFQPFSTQDVALQTAASEVLYTLLSRPSGQHGHSYWLLLLRQALQPDRISLIRQTFDGIQVLPGEDDDKYTLQKKLSDLLSILSDALSQHPEDLLSSVDVPAFFDLLLNFLQSKSLVVSIPVLHSWTKLMAVQHATMGDYVFQSLGPLVQTCSTRLLRYEAMSESDAADDAILQFLDEDFDTIPERHAFLGNYRRYCVSVVQTIARTRPLEALSHVLGQMHEMLETGPYVNGRGFDSATYSKTSLPSLQSAAQSHVVISALKGYSQWVADTASLTSEDEMHETAEKRMTEIVGSLQQWSNGIMGLPVDDPEVLQHVMETLGTILRTIKPDGAFVLRVVQHLLTIRLDDDQSNPAFANAVKAFDVWRLVELQRLSVAFPTELLEVYQELESQSGALAQQHSDDGRVVWGYRAALFAIVHRASGVDRDMRIARLQQMLKPIYDAWQDEALDASLSTFHNFCAALGLGDLAEFYKTYHFADTSDWSSQQLDLAGQAKQAEIRNRGDELPLRMTKSMLNATVEKLKTGSDEFEIARQLWSSMIPRILPNMLQMLRHASAFHNKANWSQLPDELQGVVRRTLQDRFWQSGISNESKDEFYARITGSKTSYEGFASVVRGTMRNIRDHGYHIIYLMTKFEEHFYGLADLAPSLAEALYADADSLTTNHLNPIINLTTGLVQRCPPHHRSRFLPPLLTLLFKKMDLKISSEWQAIGHASIRDAEEEELSEEMRMESVLRNLTYSTVSFVVFLLELDAPASDISSTNDHAPAKPSTSELVLSDPDVLEPLIMFCTHALRIRDTRCCTSICRVFRNLVPLFRSDEAPAPQVREFICTEVLKASITSLNEPYFADMQKELAALIAQIILLYAPRTGIPREVLLSLPDMSASKVDKTIDRIGRATNERQQRALVLDLLEGVRGVSIHEAGKIAPKKAPKKAVQQQYMEVEEKPAIVNGDEAGLEGVAGLFS